MGIMDGRCIGAARISWGSYPYIVRDLNKWKAANQGGKKWDPPSAEHSCVSGYHLQATDGEIGHVEDFIIDDETWAIRYLIVERTELVAGKKGVGFAAMDRARELGRVESLRQSLPRSHQAVAGIHGRVSANSGL